MGTVNLAAIVIPDLMLLAEELGLKAVKAMRKPEIITAIETCGALADETFECWSEAQKRRRKEECHSRGTLHHSSRTRARNAST